MDDYVHHTQAAQGRFLFLSKPYEALYLREAIAELHRFVFGRFRPKIRFPSLQSYLFLY